MVVIRHSWCHVFNPKTAENEGNGTLKLVVLVDVVAFSKEAFSGFREATMNFCTLQIGWIGPKVTFNIFADGSS